MAFFSLFQLTGSHFSTSIYTSHKQLRGLDINIGTTRPKKINLAYFMLIMVIQFVSNYMLYSPGASFAFFCIFYLTNHKE
jgi:hypothetical protein